MAERVATRIVRLKWPFIALFALLSVASLFTIDNVNINYDITEYLSEDTLTRRSLDMMNAEFGASEQVLVMFEDLAEGACAELTEYMGAMPGVINASHDPANDLKLKDGVKYERVTLLIDAPEPLAFVDSLQAGLDAREDVGMYTLTGFSPQMRQIQKNIAFEIPIAMLIAVAVVVLVLFLTSHAYIEPVLFGIVLLSSILINMGTNWVFGTISFITFAVAAILQLALAMDYSIMLLHNFTELREEGLDDKTAVIRALARSFMPISSSSLTTIAGLAALMFMSFTIGFDIGIVLSKGILISMGTVFLLMPALILCFGKLLRSTAHKPIRLGGQHIGAFAIRTRRVLPIALIVIILASAFLQSQNEYTFTDEGTSAESKRVGEVFNEQNMLVLLIPVCETDEEYAAQRALVDKLSALEYEGRGAVGEVISMVTTGAQALEYYTPSDVAEMTGLSEIIVRAMFSALDLGDSARADKLIDAASSNELVANMDSVKEMRLALDTAKSTFNGNTYSRLMVRLDASHMGDKLNELIERILFILRDMYGENFGVTGITMSIYDISTAFRTDLKRVSIITIFAILLIIMLSFRNFTVPVILVCVIQGAIWITMAISRVAGQPLFFMCYLICIAIQMGATIDYGILLTSHYRRLRATMPRAQAVREALKLSLPTVLTSGIILILAGYSIGRVCTVYYISSIGMLLSRGATISVALVLTLLPQLLYLLDKPVMRGALRADDDKKA